ncbi:MAG: FlhC family transcriptional regulator [Halochromatium sp.]|uniref:FlhC family transcriptional regulator n=1 Tax=Halochromatium sp. TaxID=2049430 RepID=UPI00397A2615
MSAQPMLERHARMQVALALIVRRARLSIVHWETRIARDALRALYREVHGEPAPSGQLPTAGGAAITTRHGQLCASVFVLFYQHLQRACSGAGGLDRRSRSIAAMIQAHDLAQLLLGPKNSLEMTLCWMLARDLRMGSARLRPCPQCQIRYLVTEQGRFDQGCPLCARYRSVGLSRLKVGLMGGAFGEDAPSMVSRVVRSPLGGTTGANHAHESDRSKR